MLIWLQRYGKAVAMVALAVALVVALHITAQDSARNAANQIVASQRDSCHSGNKFRSQVNLNTAYANRERQVVIDFLDNAATARLANYNATHLLADLTASQQYADEAAVVRATVHSIHVPLRDCAKAYPKQ